MGITFKKERMRLVYFQSPSLTAPWVVPSPPFLHKALWMKTHSYLLTYFPNRGKQMQNLIFFRWSTHQYFKTCRIALTHWNFEWISEYTKLSQTDLQMQSNMSYRWNLVIGIQILENVRLKFFWTHHLISLMKTSIQEMWYLCFLQFKMNSIQNQVDCWIP